MPINVTFTNVTAAKRGVFETTLSPEERQQLGQSANTLGTITVIGIRDAAFNERARTLSVNPARVIVLNGGSSDEAILIDLKDLPESEAAEQEAVSQSAGAEPQSDAAFFSAVRRKMGHNFERLARELMSAVRSQYAGELVEGKARKWVNKPLNFFAITIQHRDRSFAVYAKGNADHYSHLNTIRVMRDRSPYVRFKLASEDQLPEALTVIMDSARQ